MGLLIVAGMIMMRVIVISCNIDVNHSSFVLLYNLYCILWKQLIENLYICAFIL